MKLFQYITFLCCYGALMCSCTDNLVASPDENPGTPLQFSCSVASARGSQITDAAALNSMGVVGFETGALSYANWILAGNSTPNFMNNQKMEKENGSWTYSPVKYWPKESKLNFFAYAPYGTDNTGGGAGNGISLSGTTLTYVTPTNADNHPDLLVATPILEPNNGETLNFSFSHALACVSFKYEGGKTLNSITLQGINTKGTIKLDDNTPTWALDANIESITCSFTTGSDSKTDHYLMLLPQTPATGAKAILNFSDGSKEVTISATNGWEAGNRYQYVIKD